MKRVSKIGLVLMAIFSLAFFASCDKKVNYGALTAPNVRTGNTTNTFYWDAVEGAEGYVVSIDGEVRGIGNPIVERTEHTTNANGEIVTITNRICEYILDVNALTEGVHEVKFASYIKENLSAWSTVFEVSTATKVLTTPVLTVDGNYLIINSSYSSFEFDFGEGIKATYTSEQVGQNSIRINVNQLSFLPIDVTNANGENESVMPTLEVGKTYLVSVKAKTFNLESKVSTPVEFIYEEQEKIPTPVINGEHEIDVNANFKTTDYIEVYNNTGVLNIRINDKQFNNIAYLTEDYKLDIVSFVLAYIGTGNSVEKLAIQKEILAGRLEIAVQLCGFADYLTSEWSSTAFYSFVNVEEYVKTKLTVNVTDYEAEITGLEEFTLDYSVRLNGSLIEGTLESEVMKYNFISKLKFDKEVNIVNITISGTVFGENISYEVEPYQIIIADINDLFASIFQEQVTISEDGLNLLIEAGLVGEYTFEYSVLLNENELTGYKVPGSAFTGLKYDFINSGFLEIGENNLSVIARVKYNAKVIYEVEYLNVDFEVADPDKVLYAAFEQTITSNQVTLTIAEEYATYMQQVAVNFKFNNLAVACEKVSNTEYVFNFDEALDLKMGKNTFNFTVSGLYQGFPFEVQLAELTKEIDETTVNNFLNSLLVINFDAKNNVIKVEELSDYALDLTFNHYVNGVNSPLALDNKNELIVPVTFGENKIIAEATIYCYGEERTVELLSQFFYIQEYVSDVKLNGTILTWNYNSLDYVKEELYQVNVYDSNSSATLCTVLTTEKTFDFNDFDFESRDFRVNIFAVVNDELSETIDYLYEREYNSSYLYYSNNILKISNSNSSNYSYQIVADGVPVRSENITSGETKIAIDSYEKVVVLVKQLGDNIFYIDTDYKEYEINLVDSLSYNIIDGSKIIVNGATNDSQLYLNIDNSIFNYSYLNGGYFTDSFRLLDFVDSYSARTVDIFEEFSIHEGTNLVSRTLNVDLSSRLTTKVGLIVSGTDAMINNVNRLAKYEYKIVSADSSFYDGENIYEYDSIDYIDVSELEAGAYYILVRQKGQSNKFSSEWSVYTFLSFKDLKLEYELTPETNHKYSILTVTKFSDVSLMNNIKFIVNLNGSTITPETFSKNIFHFDNINEVANYNLTIDISFDSSYLYVYADKPTRVEAELNRYKYLYNETSYNKDLFLTTTDTETVLPAATREIYENTLCEIETTVVGATTTYKSVLEVKEGFYKVSFTKEDDFALDILKVDSELDFLGNKEEDINYIIMKAGSNILENLAVLALPQPFEFKVKNDLEEYENILEDQLVESNMVIYIKGYLM